MAVTKDKVTKVDGTDFSSGPVQVQNKRPMAQGPRAGQPSPALKDNPPMGQRPNMAKDLSRR